MILLGIIVLIVGYVWVRPIVILGWILVIIGLVFALAGTTVY